MNDPPLSDGAGLRARPGNAGLLPEPGGADGFVAAIAGRARSPESWEWMSAAGPVRVFDKFSVETMGSAYLGLFEEIRAGLHPLPRRRGRGRWINPSLFFRREMRPWLAKSLAAREVRN